MGVAALLKSAAASLSARACNIRMMDNNAAEFRRCLLKFARTAKDFLRGASLREWAESNMSTADCAELSVSGLWHAVWYSEKYYDDLYEYRHAHLPRYALPRHQEQLLTEHQWRALGVAMGSGWQHYAWHRPEPHVLLFRRPLGHAQHVAQGLAAPEDKPRPELVPEEGHAAELVLEARPRTEALPGGVPRGPSGHHSPRKMRDIPPMDRQLGPCIAQQVLPHIREINTCCCHCHVSIPPPPPFRAFLNLPALLKTGPRSKQGQPPSVFCSSCQG